MTDYIKNSIGRSVSDSTTCHMSVFYMDNGMFWIVCFEIMDHDLAFRTKLRGQIPRNLFKYSKSSHCFTSFC